MREFPGCLVDLEGVDVDGVVFSTGNEVNVIFMNVNVETIDTALVNA